MGHTKRPYTNQFGEEQVYFRLFRRGLLRKRDKYLYDQMWQKAEAFITPAEFAGHPLPGVTLLLMMNLGQEITIADLAQQLQDQEMEIAGLRSENLKLEDRLLDIENDFTDRLETLRNELLGMKYDEHIA